MKFKTGDYVILLNGANIPAFYGGWNKVSMAHHVGDVVKLGAPSSATDKDGQPKGFWLLAGGLDLLWDVRAMKLARPRAVLITWDPAEPNLIRAKEIDTGKQAVAKCHPGDKFDFKTGALLACERVLTEKKLWSGIVICVKASGAGLTSGRLYHVKDGALRYDDGELSPVYGNEIDFENFCAGFASEFIEYKGESQA